jgi:hypothetical protein
MPPTVIAWICPTWMAGAQWAQLPGPSPVNADRCRSKVIDRPNRWKRFRDRSSSISLLFGPTLTHAPPTAAAAATQGEPKHRQTLVPKAWGCAVRPPSKTGRRAGQVDEMVGLCADFGNRAAGRCKHLEGLALVVGINESLGQHRHHTSGLKRFPIRISVWLTAQRHINRVARSATRTGLSTSTWACSARKVSRCGCDTWRRWGMGHNAGKF